MFTNGEFQKFFWYFIFSFLCVNENINLLKMFCSLKSIWTQFSNLTLHFTDSYKSWSTIITYNNMGCKRSWSLNLSFYRSECIVTLFCNFQRPVYSLTLREIIWWIIVFLTIGRPNFNTFEKSIYQNSVGISKIKTTYFHIQFQIVQIFKEFVFFNYIRYSKTLHLGHATRRMD